jgi:hypothetical protein
LLEIEHIGKTTEEEGLANETAEEEGLADEIAEEEGLADETSEASRKDIKPKSTESATNTTTATTASRENEKHGGDGPVTRDTLATLLLPSNMPKPARTLLSPEVRRAKDNPAPNVRRSNRLRY